VLEEDKLLKELSEYIKGYLAGIIDGEGSISLNKMKRKGYKGFVWHPTVRIANTCFELIEATEDICDGGSIVPTKDRSGIRKDAYLYYMPQYIQREIIPQLLLIVKKRHKELLLEALSILKGCGRQLTYEEDCRLEQIYQEFKVLNKRGKAK
jgi:hypothetical protein